MENAYPEGTENLQLQDSLDNKLTNSDIKIKI